MPCFLRLPKDRLQHNSVDDCSVLNCVISSGNEFWFSMEKSVCDVILFDDRTPNRTLNIPLYKQVAICCWIYFYLLALILYYFEEDSDFKI